jgi:protein-tyrosine kinase
MFGQMHAIDVKEDCIDHHDEGRDPSITSGLGGEVAALPEFRIPTEPEDHLVSISDPGSIGAELLRTLVSRLRHAQTRHSLKKLLVTSAVPGEGKSLLSANLSVTLALQRKRVLLIDGDLRSSSLSRWFDIVDDSFVATWYEHGTHRLPLLRKAEGLPLWVVPAGKPIETPGNILQSSEFAGALAEIESDFDWIVIDSPPLIPFGDAGILATLADAVVLVTRRGVTPKSTLADALKSLDKGKIIATILNGANVPGHKYYHEYYSHMHRALPGSGGANGCKPQLLDSK